MTVNNLCNSCTNVACEFQSGIVRSTCAFYMPPHIEPDNCGNYIVQNPTTKNDLEVDSGKLALLEKTYTDFCQCDGGEGWLRIDDKEYATDAGYALEGMRIFMEVFKQRLAESEGKDGK